MPTRPLLVVALGGAFLLASLGADAQGPPRLTGLAVTSTAPHAGDRPLLATISPNGDGRRDRALIHFRLDRGATVEVVVAAVGTGARRVFARTLRLGAGRHVVPWSPPEGIARRTYVVRFTVRDSSGRVARYGFERPGRTPVIRVLGIEAAFTRESYVPGARAELVLASDEPALTMRVFRAGGDRLATGAHDAMNGVSVSEPVRVDWRSRGNRPGRLRVRVGDWPSGLYYAKLTAPGGRSGYAPFVVRPRRLGEHRIAVVLPTFTWQAYNFRDEDGDGYGDTWYEGGTERTLLGRAYLDGGVPPHFRSYDLGFLVWLARGPRAGQDRAVDVLADSDLSAAAGVTELALAYDLIVFPGHHEYVTRRESELVRGFRNRGGNLMFLSANNFYWCVDRRGRTLTRTYKWRNVGRHEAELTGVGYVASDRGERQAPFVVRSAGRAAWLFTGTRLGNGSRFGHFGIEIDATSRESPPGTVVLAEIPHLMGKGLTAQMTYYETPAGAKVFAAGAFTVGGDANEVPVTWLLENLWTRLAAP